MARKRKAGSRADGHSQNQPSEDDSKRIIRTYEDVADSEDEFFTNRDKILLDEGPAQKKRRKVEEEDALLEPSDEEVLSEPSDVSDLDDEDSEDDGAFSPKLIPTHPSGHDQEYGSDGSDAAAGEDDEDAYGWGTSRKDYYDADPITTEADALEEEAEARRLQKKQLQGMTEADFGFDEIEWMQAGKGSTSDDNAKGRVVTEVLPKLEITDAMSEEEKLKILRIRYPEFEPLAKEYVDLQSLHDDLLLASKAAEAAYPEPRIEKVPIATIKLNALGSYLAALCMYFALVSATDTNVDGTSEPLSPAELHDHAIMASIVRCRQLWEKAKDLEIPDPEPPQLSTANGHQTSANKDKVHVDGDQRNKPASKPRKRKSNSARKATQALAAAKAESEARRQERLQKTEESLKDLSSLTSRKMAQPSKPLPTTTPTCGTSTAKANDNDSDLGDPTSLNPHEAAQKAARKKSLKFYTSQIAQKSNRRDAAGRDAGGDADIPYRERLKDRQTRLNAEAEARGKKKGRANTADAEAALDEADDDGDNDGDKQQANLAQQVRNDEDSAYHSLIATRTATKKSLKAARAQAALEGGTIVRVTSPTPENGKRAISYAIEKNKGLTPKRKKEVRNPRVKKRKRFEDKKKKLGSLRPVWRAGVGEGRGGYGGERTGVKTGVVRSVKL
ncbi:MAG: hypothetical protein LQ350_005056 [Teloschistes chrysophthalmus]|nr:MAG: hypothetical protein LQ350_005056 [Niorma chrysophthalma]